MFAGASTATSRAVLMTIGQLSFYDQIKQIMLNSGHFQDNMITHFGASLSAVNKKCYKFTRFLYLQFFFFGHAQGAIATTMTQPLDVLKTRAMNAKPGEFKVFDLSNSFN